MHLIELLLFRLVMWGGIPLLLIVLAVGPRRLVGAYRHVCKWLLEKRLDPQDVLTRVVRQHEEHVLQIRRALHHAEKIETEIAENLRKSQENIGTLESESAACVGRGDELGARAALFKLNLERHAAESFAMHLRRQQQHIDDLRRRLYQTELQLRQYEVGRSILLSQLAEAQTVEQQFAIASHFDPFSAVANWEKAEGIVQEKALTARAVEQVYADTNDTPMPCPMPTVNPAALDEQLAELKARLAAGAARNVRSV